MPIGYLLSVLVAGAGMSLALVPLRRPRRLGLVTWILSAVVNESPFVALYWVLAATLLALLQGDLDTPLAWGAALMVGGVTVLGTPILVRRSLRARPVVDRALATGFGAATPVAGARLPWARIVLAPVPVFPPGIRRISNIPYGDAGRHNRLDVYRHRARAPRGPVLIHLHGGYFATGRKSFEARPLLHGLARHGWVCVSANYRLRPAARFPDYLVDVKRVIVWVRDHADEYGADPDLVFISGSSAGAHIAATAALTANDPAFQPGFEDRDTSVLAAVCLYGYYGPVDSTRQALPSSPADYVHPGAPPVMVAHGDQDTFVAPEHASLFVERLRSASRSPVLHVELPGAQHSFDLVHSIRFEALIDGIEAFAASVLSREVGAGEAEQTRLRRAG